jgi:hypothetical protein
MVARFPRAIEWRANVATLRHEMGCELVRSVFFPAWSFPFCLCICTANLAASAKDEELQQENWNCGVVRPPGVITRWSPDLTRARDSAEFYFRRQQIWPVCASTTSRRRRQEKSTSERKVNELGEVLVGTGPSSSEAVAKSHDY